MKTPALGLLSVVEWLATLSRSSQLSIKLSEQRRSPTPKPPWLCAPSSEWLQGPAALKTLASPSLPEGHEASSARQNPCEFPLYSKWHVPAAQCDTIRGWLCVNQMMTACWLCCPACCHSPPANPLPRESGNCFPDFHPPHTPLHPPWECCFPHLVRHSNRADPRVGNFWWARCLCVYFCANFAPRHLRWADLIFCCCERRTLYETHQHTNALNVHFLGGTIILHKKFLHGCVCMCVSTYLCDFWFKPLTSLWSLLQKIYEVLNLLCLGAHILMCVCMPQRLRVHVYFNMHLTFFLLSYGVK